MEERVAHLGGTLRLLSEPGSGTLISVVLPLAGREAKEKVAVP